MSACVEVFLDIFQLALPFTAAFPRNPRAPRVFIGTKDAQSVESLLSILVGPVFRILGLTPRTRLVSSQRCSLCTTYRISVHSRPPDTALEGSGSISGSGSPVCLLDTPPACNRNQTTQPCRVCHIASVPGLPRYRNQASSLSSVRNCARLLRI